MLSIQIHRLEAVARTVSMGSLFRNHSFQVICFCGIFVLASISRAPAPLSANIRTQVGSRGTVVLWNTHRLKLQKITGPMEDLETETCSLVKVHSQDTMAHNEPSTEA